MNATFNQVNFNKINYQECELQKKYEVSGNLGQFMRENRKRVFGKSENFSDLAFTEFST